MYVPKYLVGFTYNKNSHVAFLLAAIYFVEYKAYSLNTIFVPCNDVGLRKLNFRLM